VSEGGPDHEAAADSSTGPALRAFLLKRETRFGIAATLSFLILVVVLIVNKGRGDKDKAAADEPAKAKAKGNAPPVARIEASTRLPDKTGPKVPKSESPPVPPAPEPRPRPAAEPVQLAMAEAEPKKDKDKDKTKDAEQAPAPAPAVEEDKDKTKETNAQAPAPAPVEPAPAAGGKAEIPVDPPLPSPEPMPAAPTQTPSDPPAPMPSEPVPPLTPTTPEPTPTEPQPQPVPPPITPAPAIDPPAPTPVQEPAPVQPQPNVTPPADPAPPSTPMPMPTPSPAPLPNLAPSPATTPAPTPEPAKPAAETAGTWVPLPNVGRARILDDDRSSPEPAPVVDRDPPTPVSVATASATEPPVRGASERDRVEPVPHVVQRDENFWTISRLYYGSGRFYMALWSANRGIVSAPERLTVGQTIRIPPPEALNPALIQKERLARASASRPSPTSGSTLATGPMRKASRPGVSGEKVATASGGETEVEVALPTSDPFSRRRLDDLGPGGIDPEPPPRESYRRPRYKVRPHETLRSIARDTLGDSRRADEILDLNSDVIDDPAQLITGQLLELPDDAKIGAGRRGR
jgi:nucleoid-associated protein YgaU